MIGDGGMGLLRDRHQFPFQFLLDTELHHLYDVVHNTPGMVHDQFIVPEKFPVRAAVEFRPVRPEGNAKRGLHVAQSAESSARYPWRS